MPLSVSQLIASADTAGDALRLIRAAKDLTQADIVARAEGTIGVDQISLTEHGKRPMTSKQCTAIARALHLTDAQEVQLMLLALIDRAPASLKPPLHQARLLITLFPVEAFLMEYPQDQMEAFITTLDTVAEVWANVKARGKPPQNPAKHPEEGQHMAYDLLITNGRVVDGSGGPSFHADVAVQGGKIVGVGKFNAAATRSINAEGRVVAPGFIDHHTHYDPQALWDPLCSYSVQNGNTSVIVGMCGQTIAPARPGDHDWYLEFFAEAETIPLSAMQKGVQFTWESIAEYLEALSQRRGVNVGALVGHSGIRRYVMGEAASERADATPEEIEAMKRLIREGMRAGALGFSTAPRGRGDPAGMAPDEERWALGSVLGELGTGLFQVSGGSPQGTRGSHRTARELSSRTGRPAIYNLTSQELEHPDGWKEHLHWLEESFKAGARAYGSCVSVTAGPIFNLRLGLNVPQDEDLISPHSMFQGMPTWDAVMAQPYQERMQSLRDPTVRQALSAEAVEGTVAQERAGSDRRGRARGFFNRRWDLVQVFMTQQERNRTLEGKSVEQLAKEQGKSTMDAFLDLSLDEELQTYFICVDRNTDAEAQRQILGSPYTVIGTTDGGARPHTMDRYEYSTRLLGYWVRDQQIMPLEEAVYRMTGKTALMHDLQDRGVLAPGKAADITIFDPDTIASKPRQAVHDLPDGGVRVKRDAIGIEYVIVNGTVLLEGGEHTGALPGQVIRGPLYHATR